MAPEQQAGIETVATFALFYAILFGGTLNRLLAWSAFWRHDKQEPRRTWIPRLCLSYVFFTLIPAAYFALGVWVTAQIEVPTQVWMTMGWAASIFTSVIFLNACYRFWVAIIIWARLHPPIRDDDAGKQLTRYIDLGAWNYVRGSLVSLALSIPGLYLLWRYF